MTQIGKIPQCRAVIGMGNGTCKVDQIQVSAPQADEVLVRMKSASLCHTDHDSMSWGKPIVMGHEGAGIVERVGAEVDVVGVGDAVILNWATPCGACFQCDLGNQHLCENNSPVVAGANGHTPGHAHLAGTRWQGDPIERSFNLGTLSEYALVKSSAVVRFDSEKLAFSSASLISCGVMTGYGSVVHAGQMPRGASVVVLGTGGVGLNVIQAARIAGAKSIIAVDLSANRLEMAQSFGATHSVQASRDDHGLKEVAEQIKNLTSGRGADFAFECTAIPELGVTPLAMIRNAGTAVQVSGVEQTIPVDMTLFEWDKKYINPLYGQCNPQRDFPELIRLYERGKLMLDELVTKEYLIDEIQDAFADMHSGKNAKGVIVFSENV